MGSMNTDPRVSIGLPVYNGEKFVAETIDSILNQTFSDFELIINDNASDDRTQAICQAYATRDARIRYFRNEQNLGAAPNYNRVLELAAGEYFKWTAHDDLVAPDFLEKCIQILDQNPDVVLSYTQARLIDEYGHQGERQTYGLDISATDPQVRFRKIALDLSKIPLTPIPIFGVMRTNVAKRTPGIGHYPSSDVILTAELALYGKFYEIPEPLFLWRHHPEQSVRGILASDRGRTLWFDTSLHGKIVLHKWAQFFGYLRAVYSSPVNLMAKIKCSLIVIRWALYLSHFKSLVKDLLLAAQTIFVRTFVKPFLRKPDLTSSK